MLRAILNKSWRQHPTRHQLYGHLPPITKTIQVRRTRHAGHCWRSRDELISDVLLWTPTHGRAKAGRPARTYIQQLCEERDVVQKTCQRRWTIGKSGERGSGISVLPARHDDDADDNSSRTKALLIRWFSVLSRRHSGGVLPLQRCSQCIMPTKLTGRKIVWGVFNYRDIYIYKILL